MTIGLCEFGSSDVYLDAYKSTIQEIANAVSTTSEDQDANEQKMKAEGEELRKRASVHSLLKG